MFNFKTETAVGLFMAIAFATFFYMTFQIGFFRLDRSKYRNYSICFTDAAGLHKKADVKAFGMKVGWVDSITLVPDQHRVCAMIMILKECMLRRDATGVIRQDGILGEKYLEVIPGTPGHAILEEGAVIQGAPDVASLDALLGQMQTSITQISTLASTAHQTFCTAQNGATAQEMMRQLIDAARSLTEATQSINAFVARHEESVDKAVHNLAAVVSDLSKQLPVIMQGVQELTQRLSGHVVPAVEQTINNLAQSLDSHITNVSQQCTRASQQVEQVARKINEGKGALSQLINDEELGEGVKGLSATLRTRFPHGITCDL